MAFKWILGALGWVVGGYIGGIIGFFIGSAIDGSSQKRIGAGGGWTGGSTDWGGGYTTNTRRPYSQNEQRNSFLISLLVLSTAVMKADGKVLRSELNYIKDFIRQNFGDSAVQDSLNVIKKLLQSNIDVYQACSQIKSYMQISQRLHRERCEGRRKVQ